MCTRSGRREEQCQSQEAKVKTKASENAEVWEENSRSDHAQDWEGGRRGQEGRNESELEGEQRWTWVGGKGKTTKVRVWLLREDTQNKTNVSMRG